MGVAPTISRSPRSCWKRKNGCHHQADSSLEDLSDPEFEVLVTERRGVMNGLKLTDAQRRKALEYSGSINHGADELRKR